MASRNLWGSLEFSDTVVPPVIVLRDQGHLLENATKRLLEGRVPIRSLDTIVKLYSNITAINMDAKKHFAYDLEVVAPSLGQFSYCVLTIAYDVRLYPVIVYDHTQEKAMLCHSLESYIDVIEGILTSAEIHTVISGLLSQIKAIDDRTEHAGRGHLHKDDLNMPARQR